MVTLDWDLATAGDVTLVHVAVHAENPCTVRVRNELDGPVWPPRTRGRPAAGWDVDGYEGRVDPGRPLVLGYASPAPPAKPPMTVVDERPPADDGDATDPVAVVRALGEHGPPRGAVPQLDATGRPADDPPDEQAGEAAVEQATPAATNDECEGVPEPVEDWLSGVTARAGRAEALDGVTSVAAAREAVDDAGGLVAVRDLERQLAADEAALSAVEERCEHLADRVERTDVPTATLERLG